MANSRKSFDQRLAALINDEKSETHKAIFGDKPKPSTAAKASSSSSSDAKK